MASFTCKIFGENAFRCMGKPVCDGERIKFRKSAIIKD